jgi:hypothetical protein
LRELARRIAASSNWDLSDYRLELHSTEGQLIDHSAFESPSANFVSGNRFDGSEILLDNPGLAAIREALRHFCPCDDHQQLRVGPVRSPAEFEDLLAIDSAAYAEASITYEKFEDWWVGLPARLGCLVFQKSRNGRYWNLAVVTSVRRAAENGRTQRVPIDWPCDAHVYQPTSQILVRVGDRLATPAHVIPGNQSTLITRHWFVAQVRAECSHDASVT